MDSLVVDVVEMNVIMGSGMHSLVSCFAVSNRNLAVVADMYRCYDRGCAHNTKMLRATGGCVGNISGYSALPPKYHCQISVSR